MCHYNSELSKLPDGFHNALFTNLLAAPLSILRDAMKKQIEKKNYNNSSLSLINPETAPYKLPLPVNKTVHLNFVNRKVTGLDNISGKLLRECRDLISESLSCLFNLSIKKKIFADEWKAQELLHSTRMKENVQI